MTGHFAVVLDIERFNTHELSAKFQLSAQENSASALSATAGSQSERPRPNTASMGLVSLKGDAKRWLGPSPPIASNLISISPAGISR